jgi:hypothetical protein
MDKTIDSVSLNLKTKKISLRSGNVNNEINILNETQTSYTNIMEPNIEYFQTQNVINYNPIIENVNQNTHLFTKNGECSLVSNENPISKNQTQIFIDPHGNSENKKKRISKNTTNLYMDNYFNKVQESKNDIKKILKDNGKTFRNEYTFNKIISDILKEYFNNQKSNSNS